MSDRSAAAPVPEALRVGFATGDLEHVDQHFGSARRIALYEVDAGGARLLEVCAFAAREHDGNEAKLAERIEALAGTTLVYVQAVGASAIRQLVTRGVQPVKVPAGTPLAGLIAELRRDLRAGPPRWLDEAIRRRRGADPRRFEAMAAEGWVE